MVRECIGNVSIRANNSTDGDADLIVGRSNKCPRCRSTRTHYLAFLVSLVTASARIERYARLYNLVFESPAVTDRRLIQETVDARVTVAFANVCNETMLRNVNAKRVAHLVCAYININYHVSNLIPSKILTVETFKYPAVPPIVSA